MRGNRNYAKRNMEQAEMKEKRRTKKIELRGRKRRETFK